MSDNQASIHDGLLSTAEFIASPNFGQRPNPHDIRLIVIHNISLPPSDFEKLDKTGVHYVKAFFQNQLNPDDHPYFATIYQQQVSSHLFIERNGAITQFVNLNERAWHAGRSHYLGVSNCNDYSIGIELEGDDYTPFTDAQYQSLAASVTAIYAAYPRTRSHLAGHSDIARGRKSDPGIGFDWQRLRSMIAHSHD